MMHINTGFRFLLIIVVSLIMIFVCKIRDFLDRSGTSVDSEENHLLM